MEPFTEGSNLIINEHSNRDDSSQNTNHCYQRCPRILIAFIAFYIIILVLFLTLAVEIRKESRQPHIVMIVLDDLGWGDVEWVDDEMRTPVLNSLRQSGILFNNSYTHPLDSPSRATIFSGIYPFHVGLQHEIMKPRTPTFVPKNVTFFTQHLKNFGYNTYMLGKWNLGFCDWKYTPGFRGFDFFNGFYTDNLDYYTHSDIDNYYDFRLDKLVDISARGIHSTYLLTERATEIVYNHDVSVPLFLYVALQAVHSPVQVPEIYVNKTCKHIINKSRISMCGMIAMVDEGIGNITEVLRHKDMFHNTILIVTSDNGGVVKHGSSNKPLLGEYGDLYEGGTRVMTLVSATSYLYNKGQTYNGLFHQADWYPTILSMIDSDQSTRDLDGVDQWNALIHNGASPRKTIVYNVDEEYKNAAIRVGDFKLITGPTNYDDPKAYLQSNSHQLFNLAVDPLELTNLASALPDKVHEMNNLLNDIRKTLVKSKNIDEDSNADPSLWNEYWSPGWC